MSDFYNFVKNFFSTNECTDNTKYSSIGHTFCFNTDEAEGIYWFYEGENFTIDIHDVFIKKEIIHTSFSGLDNFYSFYSSYLITANGESFNPRSKRSPWRSSNSCRRSDGRGRRRRWPRRWDL